MDNRVRVRFFRPTPVGHGTPPLAEAFRALLARGKTARERELEAFPGVIVRMERLREADGFLDAEIVRVQRGNMPPEATDDGLIPLTVGGLGHSTVISYHAGLNVMAVQMNHNMTVGRALDYLHRGDTRYDYRADPLVRQDAWDRYNRGHPRKLKIKIASPQNLPAVEGRVGALTDMSKRLAEMADAPMITLEVSMGSRRAGQLSKDFVDGVVRLFTTGEARDHDIRDFRVTTSVDDERAGPPIDFLDDVLQDETTLDLPAQDTEAHFERRRAYVRACFNDHIDYIAEVYGANG